MKDENQDLAKYQEQGRLEKITTVYDKILSYSGFSDQFYESLLRLNDSMGRVKSKSDLSRFKITLSPDAENPMPVFKAEFNTYDLIQLDVSPESETHYLKIGDGRGLLVCSELGDVQYFVKELLPNKSASLNWEPIAEIGKPPPEEKPIKEEFLSLTPTSLGKLAPEKYKLKVGDLKDPLFLLRPNNDSRLKEAICDIYGFSFEAEPKEIERAMDLLSQLFDKPYPLSNPRLRKPP